MKLWTDIFRSLNIISTPYKSSKKGLIVYGKPDLVMVLLILIIAVFGIIMVYDSSVAISIRDFGTPYRYVIEQLRWLILGLISLYVCSRIDYHRWYALSLPLLVVVSGLLLAVFIPGLGVKALGAHRWLNFGFFYLQPAELAKLVMILYLAAWLSRPGKDRFMAFLLLLGGIGGLVILEPDLGTSIIIISIAIAMYFLSGAPMKQFVFLFPILGMGLLLLIVIAPYRFQRLITFLNPDSDPLGSSYQIKQALLALGSGGWFGVGIGKSKQKYEYLPEANTDSIFAIIGEEVGYIGALGIMSLFLFLVWRGFRIATAAPDSYGRLIALGVVVWIGVQVCINLGAMVAIIPLTGVPLPLISSGGSSLIIMLSALGIVLNISRQARTSI